MPIALDATYSTGRELTGIGVYSREILFGLAALHPEEQFVFCYRPHRFFRSLREPLPRNAARRVLHDRWFLSRARVFHGLNQRLPGRKLRCAVATFHDLFVLNREYSAPEFRERFARQAKETASRADLIICVSAFTARQVEELLGVDRARLRVIHHGARHPVEAADSSARERMFLHVGALQTRKNIGRVVAAFERLPEDCRLVLAGSASGYGAEEILARIEQSPRRAAIVLAGYVDAPTLDRLYARATALVFPSLDEGFGMPVLDAMARGLPVITSNRSALPEVAGDAALLVDPCDVNDLAGAMQSVLKNENLGAELARRGRNRAAQFSWDRAVEKTWEIYQELT
ncbi:MAG: glycosyltransferase family 4 protein [Acidobacteria bacterium]|nr:glycosyltransferase family 4 protein [Acidobacteriota bacterium]